MVNSLSTRAMSALICLGLIAGSAMAASILESEPNNSVAAAQNIDAHFGVGANPDILNATTVPWVSISGTGNGTFDYYSFTVAAAGVTGVFDIDYGYGAGGSMDTELFLCTSTGTLLAHNDDAATSLGAGGSVDTWPPISFDSYISYTFGAPGTYVIGVGEWYSSWSGGGITGNPPDSGDTYTLQVSNPAPVPEPCSLLLFGIGGVGLAAARRRKRTT